MRTLIYLASPYSHRDPYVRNVRFVEACRAAAYLNHCGRPCYSPIAHSHPMTIYCARPMGTDYEAWRALDEAIIAACSEVIVLKLGGWMESHGIEQEVALAERLGLPVSCMEPVR